MLLTYTERMRRRMKERIQNGNRKMKDEKSEKNRRNESKRKSNCDHCLFPIDSIEGSLGIYESCSHLLMFCNCDFRPFLVFRSFVRYFFSCMWMDTHIYMYISFSLASFDAKQQHRGTAPPTPLVL